MSHNTHFTGVICFSAVSLTIQHIGTFGVGMEFPDEKVHKIATGDK